jgi:hypothetical protein
MEGESAEPEGPSEEPQEDQTDAGVPADLPSGSAWATRWAESAQGWVTDTNGATTWRPIVSTLHSVSRWNIDTHLGVVSGDSPLTGHEGLAEARESALEALVQESLTRGAHAVVGVEILVHQIGDNVVLTATGTAVTLSPID